MNDAAAGQAVRLPLSMREFDLSELMTTVGDHGSLRWVLRGAWFNGDVRAVWPAGHEYAEAESEKPDGLEMTWHEMRRLGETCQQVIDGRFTGYDLNGQPVLQLHAFDSSYWLIWAADGAVLERVRAAFPDAEAYDEPTPESVGR
jgi:hypothetical protein